MILSGAIILSQSEPVSEGNEVVLRIPKSSSITWASRSDCLLSYPGHSFLESYPGAEMQSVYSTAPAEWAKIENIRINFYTKKKNEKWTDGKEEWEVNWWKIRVRSELKEKKNEKWTDGKEEWEVN